MKNHYHSPDRGFSKTPRLSQFSERSEEKCERRAGRRELLRDTVRFLGGWFAGKVPVRPPVLLRIGESCDACGACARVCQTGAIAVERKALDAASVEASILYDPSACVECHSCEAVCWPKAIRFEQNCDAGLGPPHIDPKHGSNPGTTGFEPCQTSLSWPFARGKLAMRTMRGRDCKTCGALVADGAECRLCGPAGRPAGANDVSSASRAETREA